MSDERNVVPIDIDADQWDAIEEIVRRTGRSRHQVLRIVIDLGLAAQRENEQDTKEPT